MAANSSTPTFWSRFGAAITAGIGGAFATGLINSKQAAYIAIASAVFNAFQHPVQGTDAPQVPQLPVDTNK